jgi:lysyl-tRNA synthetase class II
MSERLEDIKSRRIEKIHRLESMGISPYPSTTGRTHTNAQALSNNGTATKINDGREKK